MGLPKQGEDTFKCNICGNGFKSEASVKIHKGKTHTNQDVKSKPVSPMKDEREESPNLQIFDCDVCGEKC